MKGLGLVRVERKMSIGDKAMSNLAAFYRPRSPKPSDCMAKTFPNMGFPSSILSFFCRSGHLGRICFTASRKGVANAFYTHEELDGIDFCELGQDLFLIRFLGAPEAP